MKTTVRSLNRAGIYLWSMEDARLMAFRRRAGPCSTTARRSHRACPKRSARRTPCACLIWRGQNWKHNIDRNAETHRSGKRRWRSGPRRAYPPHAQVRTRGTAALTRARGGADSAWPWLRVDHARGRQARVLHRACVPGAWQSDLFWLVRMSSALPFLLARFHALGIATIKPTPEMRR